MVNQHTIIALNWMTLIALTGAVLEAQGHSWLNSGPFSSVRITSPLSNRFWDPCVHCNWFCCQQRKPRCRQLVFSNVVVSSGKVRRSVVNKKKTCSLCLSKYCFTEDFRNKRKFIFTLRMPNAWHMNKLFSKRMILVPFALKLQGIYQTSWNISYISHILNGAIRSETLSCYRVTNTPWLSAL